HPGIVAAINEELAKATQWAATNRDKVAQLYTEASGVELAAQERAVKRTDFTFSPITPALIAEQQAVADRFHRVGLIPKPIKVADIVWVWKPAA
ncbi:MAG: sulfonate ABC transporter substrate-binding protein, partial [Proteobacteria bacterium]|nr:sulfonate ABC transporter substrate-binding protein [Pseudomonadota bacterium]